MKECLPFKLIHITFREFLVIINLATLFLLWQEIVQITPLRQELVLFHCGHWSLEDIPSFLLIRVVKG